MTAVSIVYNTKDLIKEAVESVKKLYPSMGFLIIDGSDIQDDCYWYLENLKTDCFKVIHTHRNIGHGSGLHLAMQILNDEYVLFFDSDIEMYKPCIEEMQSCFDNNVYGVGVVSEYVIDDLTKDSSIPKTGEMIKLLNAYFCIIKREKYFQYAPIISNEAPMILTWLDIHRKKKDRYVDFPVNEYVYHKGAQTRNKIPYGWRQGHINWQLAWEKYIEYGN